MTLRLIAATALLALAACGQSSTTSSTSTTPAAAQGLMEQIQAQSPEMRPVTAWEQIKTHAETMPACSAVRRTESMGIVPANVAPDSAYAGHAGELVFNVQCGAQLTTVGNDPHAHWLIFFAPGAATSTIVSCADRAADRCLLARIPTAEPAAATTTSTP